MATLELRDRITPEKIYVVKFPTIHYYPLPKRDTTGFRLYWNLGQAKRFAKEQNGEIIIYTQ